VEKGKISGLNDSASNGKPDTQIPKKNEQYRRLFAYAGNFRYLTYASVVLSAISAILALIPYVYIWKIIQEILIVMPEYGKAGHIVQNGWTAALFALAAILVYVAALMCSHIAAFRIARNIRSQTIRHTVSLPTGMLDRAGSGKIRNIIDQSSAATETFLAHQTPDMAGATVTPVAIIILLFIFDWRLGIASLIPVAAGFLVMTRMTGKRMIESMRQYTDALEDMNKEAVEYVRGIAVVKTFGQTAFSFSRFKDAVERYETWVVRYTNSLRGPMIAFTLCVNGVFALLIGAAFLFTGGVNADPLFLADFLFYVIFTPIIPVTLLKIMFSSENNMIVNDAMNRIDSLLAMQPLPEAKTNIKKSGIREHSDIVISRISFTYENNAEPALDNVSLVIPAGKTTALVGPSGGGKTTLAALISRNWDVDSGTISIGGTNIRGIPKKDLMKLVSFVFQDSRMLKMSILDNVRLGRPEASRKDVRDALHRAQCDDIIGKLPDGIDTIYGSGNTDGGVYLSGGECQRLAVARVILNDTPIVILDEATAFADPETEYLMQRAFAELSKHKTVIKIAHRLSTVKTADCINVLDNGHIVESGTHAQLLKKNELYTRMWNEYRQSIRWTIKEEL
jgi:ATP-binding cassette subfamily B protein